MSEWLNGLKVGDKVVIIASGAIGSTNSISTIVRITKTLFFTESGRKFKISNGRSPGSGWYHTSLAEPTQKRMDEIRQTNLAARLKQVDWKTVPLKTLRAVWELLPKST